VTLSRSERLVEPRSTGLGWSRCLLPTRCGPQSG